MTWLLTLEYRIARHQENLTNGLNYSMCIYDLSFHGHHVKFVSITCQLHLRRCIHHVGALFVDCSEIFIDIPKSYQAQSKTYSNYKKYKTIKFRIAITPACSMCFLFNFWGG